MPEFLLGEDVHANVAQLLEALGSVKRALSYGDLAELLNERDQSRKRYPSTVQKWIEGVVPDLRSIKLMAELAGVSFEEFALGTTPITSGKKALTRAMAAAADAPRGAQLEPKDVPAPDPRKATAKKPEDNKRAG